MKQLFVNPLRLIEKQKQKQKKENITTYTNTQSKKQPQYQQNQPLQQQPLLIDTLIKTTTCQSSLSPIPKSKQISKHLPNVYRTRMCPEGLQCRHRMTCPFAHTQHELRRPYKNRKSVCIRYQKGLCGLGSVCSDYHGNMDLKKNYKYKHVKCKEYEETRMCKNGILCIYVHDEKDKDGGQMLGGQQIEEQVQGRDQNENQLIEIEQQQLNGNHQQNNESKSKYISNNNKKQIKDIFSQSTATKKISVTQIVQKLQPLSQSLQSKQQQQIDEGFNIELNF